MMANSTEGRSFSRSGSLDSCLICTQVITPGGTLRHQLDSRREESGLILHQIARLLQVSSSIYHETDLDALPVPLLCSSCHETVSSGLELQEVIGKLQAQLQRLTEMIKWYFIRSYGDDCGPLEDGSGCLEMKRIRKTYAQCLASHTPFFPFSDLQNDDDEIKIEVELNPDHFQYDAITTDGLEERNQLANTVPETRDTNLDFNPHSYNPSNFVPQSGTEHCNTEHSDLHNSNQDNPEESSNIPVKVADEKDCVHQRLDNADSNGQPNFEKDHLNSLGNDVDATIPESWTEDTCTLGRHFMSFHQSSDRTDDGEDTTETNCKLNNMDSDNQSCSSESDSDSDYRPSTSRAIRTKPKKKISLAKKLSTAMNNSVKDRKCPHCNFYISKRVDFHRHVELHRGEKDFPCKQCPARFSSMTEAIAHNTHTHKYSRGNLSQKPFNHGALRCNLCKQLFYCRDRYDFHMKQHDSPEEAISVHIQTTLDHEKNLTSFQCNLCSKTFSKESYVTPKNNVRIVCQHGNCSCKTVFRDFTEFMHHHKTICTKSFWRNRGTVTKRCVCDQCGIAFGSPQSLIVHQRCKHAKEKAGCFICKVCGVKFSDKNIMKNHIARCYPPITFVCQFCYQMCGRQDILNAHLLTHHPEKTLHLQHPT